MSGFLSYNPKTEEFHENTPVNIIEHEVEEYYKIIPAHYAIDGVGNINRQHSLEVTDKNSLMIYDSEQKQIVNLPISEAVKQPRRYFLMFGSPPRDLNEEVFFKMKYGYESSIKLDHLTGFLFAMYLKHLVNAEIVSSTKLYDYLTSTRERWSRWVKLDFEFFKKTYNSSLFRITIEEVFERSPFWDLINTTVIRKKELYHVVNELIFSSNTEFVLGMLECFVFTEKNMTHEISELLTSNGLSVNIYTNILNYLFSNYTLVKARYKHYPDDVIFSINFELSPALFNQLKIAQSKIRQKQWTWKILPDGALRVERWETPVSSVGAINETVRQLIELKEKDRIKFIRFDELVVVHTRTDEPVKLYDLVMGYGDANNYLLPAGPFCKNSDGDILTLMGLMSKESIETAKKHSLQDISRMKDALNPDEVSNWIQKDAVGGLYVATKEK